MVFTDEGIQVFEIEGYYTRRQLEGLKSVVNRSASGAKRALNRNFLSRPRILKERYTNVLLCFLSMNIQAGERRKEVFSPSF